MSSEGGRRAAWRGSFKKEHFEPAQAHPVFATDHDGTRMSLSRNDQIKQLLRDLNRSGIRDRRVLTAISAVPREAFVSPQSVHHAWENRALPIEEGQTISQPLIVALMSQALNLSGDERVLEIGTGSGYQAAILAELAHEVISIERFERLAEQARERLSQLGYSNVTVVVGDGTLGWPEGAPFDRIIVTAAAPHLPRPLEEQLSGADGSRIVIPIGDAQDQDLVIYERYGAQLREINLGAVRFVPLIGEEGWREQQSS
jgi:protein-L-isoaspartate(D-aspartate) O-methyltransferase